MGDFSDDAQRQYGEAMAEGKLDTNPIDSNSDKAKFVKLANDVAKAVDRENGLKDRFCRHHLTEDHTRCVKCQPTPTTPSSNTEELDLNGVFRVKLDDKQAGYLWAKLSPADIGKIERHIESLITTTVEKATQERDNSIEELAKRLYVAKNEQRAIDMTKYGADIYSPITLEDCLAELKANHRGES